MIRDKESKGVILLTHDPSVVEALSGNPHYSDFVIETHTDISDIFSISDNLKSPVLLLADFEIILKSGLQNLKRLKMSKGIKSLILVADTTNSEHLLNLEAGSVDDVFFKPINPDLFRLHIEPYGGIDLSETRSLAKVEPYIQRLKPYIIFRSREMKQVLVNLPRIAQSDQTVLISGETGTGKELVARAVHTLSPRVDGTFVGVNCGAIPDSLFEGELFGFEKGAFTGATKTHRGKIEVANGGTLFLDEIGDMPLTLQVKLLRVLEEGILYRLGGEQPIRVDVRIIAATRRDLSKAVEEGLFRDDLYYRLNVLRIHLPPLRERKDDIPLLSLYFLHRALKETGYGHPFPSLSPGTIDMLQRLPWKGNVRELRNLLTRVAIFLDERKNTVLPTDILPHLDEASLREIISNGRPHTVPGVFIPIGTPLRDAEDILINETLRYTGGNKTKASRILGIGLRTLRRKTNKK
ncbi:MAG: sigma-54-dependent Fis family transcriptional regulator [Nitrospirae bacterium]|nr:MAG: sigma-54-dependent Fis family transcriptional regulator [Nitrospirota bacterium]